MNVLSLFSGVGGIDMAMEAAGHRVVGMCEIDPKPRSVLRRHWPDIPIWEDVTNVRACACTSPMGEDHAPQRVESMPVGDLRTHDPESTDRSVRCTDCGGIRHGRVDLVAGGSPCQDLSVAGRRAGLDGERSGLFWHQCRIAAQSGARWVLWENVAGALSSNDGEDFAAVLWGLTGVRPAVPEDGWRTVGVCVGPERTAVWRLLDARWFGVAQRRRRVFVVAGPRDECGPEILLEPESCGGDLGARPTAGEDVAGTLGGGSGGRGWAADTDRMTFVPTVHHAFDSTWSGRYPVSSEDVSPTETPYAHQLNVGGGKPGQGYPAIRYNMAVRRLTPRECERLMGWPDDHTRWDDQGHEIADSHRYRMCGNGVVAPVAEWIARRLPL